MLSSTVTKPKILNIVLTFKSISIRFASNGLVLINITHESNMVNFVCDTDAWIVREK